MNRYSNVINGIPVGLIALLIFSALTSIFALYYYTFADETLRDALVPHVGWIGLLFYVYFLLFSLSLIATRKEKLRKITIYTFMFYIAYGLLYFVIRYSADSHGNPYLTYGRYRPVWDIVLPLFWVYVLSTKQVKEYCNVSL